MIIPINNKLFFGTAGIPLSTPERNTLNGLSYLNSLGLEGMELEFVRAVNISKDKTPEIKQTASKYHLHLTCHAPYFINLNSFNPKIISASKQRIIQSARIAWLCGATSVAFHAAYYLKADSSKVYTIVKKEVKEIINFLKDEGVKIWLRPETTGKETQWGNVSEIIRLSEELEQVQPCIDFAHLYARSIGKINQQQDFSNILNEVEKKLGAEALKNMHIHLSGIFHGEKGERYHLPLKESKFNYSAVLKSLKEYNCRGIVICESPLIESDALLMQKEYHSL